jgi:hypothetical protein
LTTLDVSEVVSVASAVVFDGDATSLERIVMNVSRFMAVDPYLDAIVYAFSVEKVDPFEVLSGLLIVVSSKKRCRGSGYCRSDEFSSIHDLESIGESSTYQWRRVARGGEF